MTTRKKDNRPASFLLNDDAEPAGAALCSLFATFIAAMRAMCKRHPAFDDWEARQAEWDAHQASEVAIKRRYAHAYFRREELDARAKRHGVDFSFMTSHAHRAAMLDFLDNPNAPTLLNSMHMTWFRGIDANGVPTQSRVHPVNRAIYNWNARDVERMRPRGDPNHDHAVANLNAHFPIIRVDWTAQQWVAHEQGKPIPDRPPAISLHQHQQSHTR